MGGWPQYPRRALSGLACVHGVQHLGIVLHLGFALDTRVVG